MDRGVPLAPAAAGSEGLGHQLTRRRLLQGAGAVALTFATGAGVQRALAGTVPPGLRRSDYEPFVGRRFRLSAGASDTLSIPLAAVQDVQGGRDLAGSEDAFILLFHAPPGSRRLDQAVMLVEHPAGWSQRLLVSPASTGHHGLDYAAVINRAHDKE